MKHLKKMDFSQKLIQQEKMFVLYLKLVDAYKKGIISVKKDCEQFGFDTPYVSTYVSLAYLEGRILCLDEQVEEYVPSDKPEYNLKELDKAILTHKHFGIWLIVFSIMAIVYFTAAVIITYAFPDHTNEAFRALVDVKGGLIPFAASTGLLLFTAIFILIKNACARKNIFVYVS